MARVIERGTTWLWAMLVGGLGLTMLCAVGFKSWRTSGSSAWSDGGSAWVVSGFVGSAAVLALLVVALLADAGWFDRLHDAAWLQRATLLAATAVSSLTSVEAWSHRRHLEETLMEGWTLDVSWGLAWAPWVSSSVAVAAALLLATHALESRRIAADRRYSTVNA